MPFIRETQRLLFALLITFVVIAITAAYWAVLGPERILPRDDNPRLFEERAAIQRGEIYDRNNARLVESIRGDNNRVSRQYLYPDLSSVLGYYSLRYGVGGAEAAYDTLLNGDNLEQTLSVFFERDLLHQPQQGTDIRLTIDASLQNEVIAAMGDYSGAAVVLSVPDGAVLALASLPTFNANQLDAEWDTLTQDEKQPFFNRALQGNYQLGNLSYTLLSIAALIEPIPLDATYNNSADPVEITDVTLNCLLTPPSADLSIADAYIYGCPEPFLRVIQQLGNEQISEHFDLFYFENPFELGGFIPAMQAAEATPEPTPPQNFRLEDALGQGMITVSPLHMATLTAAFINGGNAPQPYILDATKTPGSTLWQPVPSISSSLPITTLQVSRDMQNLMRAAVADGTAKPAAINGLDIGGQAGIAYSGETTLTWFIGFARQDTRQGVVLALVLEDTADYAQAAEMGGKMLAAAANLPQP